MLHRSTRPLVPVFKFAVNLSKLGSSRHSSSVPRKAQVVVCGGGVVGTSVAYHLAARGVKEVILLERGRLTCGTTWHSAGLVGNMRHSGSQIQLSLYSQNLYKWMEENGYPTGFKQCGSLNIGASIDRMTDMRRAADMCRVHDIPVFELTSSEVKERIPWINTENIQGGFWLPTDGVASPSDVCQSLAKMAAEKGAQVVEGCEVIRVMTSKEGSVSGVETSLGNIQCQNFILCGGMWSRNLAAQTIPSVPLPLQPTEHFYLITQPVRGMDNMAPVIRDADSRLYGREWSGGFLLGVFEHSSLPVFPDGPPKDFQFQLLSDNWEHFQPYYEAVRNRFPFLKDVEIRHLNNGPETFTEDGHPLIGEVAEVPGFLVATAMNSRGITLAGGVGRTIAELIVDGVPSVDCSVMDVKRTSPKQNVNKRLWDMAHHIVGDVYAVHYPKHIGEIANTEQTSLAKLQKDLGAVMGLFNGRHIPLWFKRSPTDVHNKGTYGKPSWFDAVQEEMSACRQGLAFANVSAIVGALTITGPSDCVDKLFVDPVCGSTTSSVIHTAMLNNHGQYVARCMVVAQGHDSYLCIFARPCERHLMSWLKKQKESGISFQLLDDRETFALLGSQPLLDGLLSSQAEMPKDRSAIVCTLGNKACLLLKCYWLPANHVIIWTMLEGSDAVYNHLLEGSGGALRSVGLHCFEGLRVEEGIPWWNFEVNSASTPLTAGTATKILNQSKDFIGRAALTRGSGIQKCHSLIHFTLEGASVEDKVWPWGGEPVYVGARHIGYATSVCYSAKRSAFNGLALVQLERPWEKQQMELLNAGRRYKLKIIQ